VPRWHAGRNSSIGVRLRRRRATRANRRRPARQFRAGWCRGGDGGLPGWRKGMFYVLLSGHRATFIGRALGVEFAEAAAAISRHPSVSAAWP